MIIAIDGPAGVGKSTVARAIARELGFTYLDTGAMYRAVAYRALTLGVSVDDDEALAEIARRDAIEFVGESGVHIAGIDVTKQIRTPEVDKAVSPVSAVPAVREALVDQQRAIAEGANIVMEGRDIGTVVFPNAEVKVFLTASAAERAKRRALQNIERGVGETDPAVIQQQIEARDLYDSTRATAPLRAAEDACTVDTTELSIAEVIEAIVELAVKAGAKRPA